MKTNYWDVLARFHWDVVGCFIWDVPATSLGRTKRRRYDFHTTSFCRVGSIAICVVIVKAISVEAYWQKQPQQVFYKKRFLTNFSKFTGKHLCHSLFFKTLYYGFFPVNFLKCAGPLYLQSTFGQLLLHLEPCQVSMIELSCGNNSASLTVFEKKTLNLLIRLLITYLFMENFFMHCIENYMKMQQQSFTNVLKNGVLKNLANFTGNSCVEISF